MSDGRQERNVHRAPARIVGLLLLPVVLLLPTGADAYIDPGSSTIGLQALLALFAAGALTVRGYVRAFLARLGRRSRASLQARDADASPDADL